MQSLSSDDERTNAGDRLSQVGPFSQRHGSWSERFVSAGDGTRLYLRERSGGDLLHALLCDGIACDGFVWRYLAEDLLRVGRVSHWNYRGHGRSGRPVDTARHDISVFAEDLVSIREAVAEAPEPLVLFGHSMGCQAVLESYRRSPDRVAAMVLICGTAGRLTHTFKGTEALAQALPRMIESVQRNPRIARALWSNVPPNVAVKVAFATGEVDAAMNPADLLPYMEHVTDLDPLMFLRMLHEVGEQSAEDMLASIEVPVLVIAGENDTFTPTHLAERMAAAIPNSELMVEKGATHIVPLERREVIKEAVLDFVRRRVVAHRSEARSQRVDPG